MIEAVPGSASAILRSGLNDRGQVVGANGLGRRLRLDEARDTGLWVFLLGGDAAYATTVNERGDVAGHALTPHEGLPSAAVASIAKQPPRCVDR